jgi:hypothetical protein
VTSSNFERLPELSRKLQRDYNVDQRQLRQQLFESALEGGYLDRELEDMFPEWDAEDSRSTVTAADFPDYLPYEGFDIDPDLENLNAFRFAAENPKAREFVSQNSSLSSLLPGGSRDDAQTAYLQAVQSGALSPAERETLRYAGDSRFLQNDSYSGAATDALNQLLQEYTGERGIDYSENINNLGDLLAEADDIIAPIERGLTTRTALLNTADQAVRAVNPLTERLGYGVTQPGLPFGDEAAREVLTRLENVRENSPGTVEELRQQLTDLQNLRGLQRSGAGSTFPIEGSAVLPQVEEAITRGRGEGRRQYLMGEAERLARDPSRNTLYQLQRDLAQEEPRGLSAEQTLSALNRPLVELDPWFNTSAGADVIQEPLYGISLELADTRDKAIKEAAAKQITDLNQLVERYPEIGPYLQAPLTRTTPKVERDIEKLRPYLDLEQEISKPETRSDIYNRAFKELGVQPSYLSQIELDYTSGEAAKQREAIDRLVLMGYGPELQAGSAPAVSRRTPVVGGGGYAQGAELQESLKYLDQRREDLRRVAAATGSLPLAQSVDPLAVRNPQLQPAPREMRFSFDPATNQVTPDPSGEYGIQMSVTSAPTRFNLSPEFAGTEMSRNVLRFLQDNPITRMGSVSFSTRTPDSGGYNMEAKDIPAPVFDEMNRFISSNVLSEMQPGMMLENRPIRTYDIARLREEQGKAPSESSILRREQQFVGESPNRRGAAYRSVGFGPLSRSGNQLLYMNSEGNIVPLQPERPARSLAGGVEITSPVNEYDKRPLQAQVSQSREPLTAKAYYSTDPVTAAVQGLGEYGKALRRTPSALLPGAADLIPSPEAIQTGYREGALPMAQQMGREFVQSLPAAAGYSAALAAAPVLAPGVGAGMVGTAGARALNEVVRQETGEGIVPKLRQALGTAPRTGVASPTRVGPQPLVQQIRPLTQTQRTEQQRQQNRSEAQRQFDLMRQRFNPRGGEFGVSEALRGIGSLLLGR